MHNEVSTNYPWLAHNQNSSLETPEKYRDMVPQPLGNVKVRSDRYLRTCYEAVEGWNGFGSACWFTEECDRELMRVQPKGSRNFTQTGFHVMDAPLAVFESLREFFELNKDKKSEETHELNAINHWEAPTDLYSVLDKEFHGSPAIKDFMVEHIQPIVESWTGQELEYVSLYGVRKYGRGAILKPHVDRHPLVSSVIINVAQDVDEP
jgi:prolyl 4-hydroxylase